MHDYFLKRIIVPKHFLFLFNPFKISFETLNCLWRMYNVSPFCSVTTKYQRAPISSQRIPFSPDFGQKLSPKSLRYLPNEECERLGGSIRRRGMYGSRSVMVLKNNILDKRRYMFSLDKGRSKRWWLVAFCISIPNDRLFVCILACISVFVAVLIRTAGDTQV